MVNKSPQADRKPRVKNVAEHASFFLENNNTQKAYQYLLGWYKPAKAKATNPTGNNMQEIQQEYKTFYEATTPTEPSIQMFTAYINNKKTPAETEIAHALQKMRLKKAAGPSGITMYMIKQWHHKARLSEENVRSQKRYGVK
jgi:hypothetical protein